MDISPDSIFMFFTRCLKEFLDNQMIVDEQFKIKKNVAFRKDNITFISTMMEQKYFINLTYFKCLNYLNIIRRDIGIKNNLNSFDDFF
jgi:hypothetical protein